MSRKKKKRVIKLQRRRKIAVLVTTTVMLLGIGLEPVLIFVRATNAISKSQKVEAANLDSENQADEIAEEKEDEESTGSEPKEEQVTEEATENQLPSDNQEVTNELVVEEVGEKATSTGTWGTSPWGFDEASGVLTIGEGELTGYANSPWNRTDDAKVDAAAIKEIVLTGKVVAPVNSNYLFSSDSSNPYLKNLTTITNLNQLDTSKVKNMRAMFSGASSVTTLDVSKFDTTQVTTMYQMFSGASSVTTLDVSEFDTSQVTSMDSMFYNASSVTTLDVSEFDTSKVTTMTNMFRNVKLKTLTLGAGFNFVGNAGLGAPLGLQETDVLTGNWIREDGKSKGYNPTDFMANYGTGDLTPGTYVAETVLWGTSPWGFDEASGVLTIGEGELTGYKESPWNREDGYRVASTAIKEIVLTGKVVAPVDSTRLFSGEPIYIDRQLGNMISITNLNQLDTSQVEGMWQMFYGARSLETLDVSGWDTSQVTNMTGMFSGANSVTTLDVSKFNTSQVTDMSSMFKGAKKLVMLDVNGFNTSKVTNMSSMFNKTKVRSLDISDFDTSKVTNMNSMFSFMRLQRLTLGEDFKFVGNADLGAPMKLQETDVLTGNWIREDGESAGYNPIDFMANYGKDDLTLGTYVAELEERPLWGTSPWIFDENSGVLTIEEGTLTSYKDSPWNRKDDAKVDAAAIKEIVLTGNVVAPVDSMRLFSDDQSEGTIMTNLEAIKNIEKLDTSQVTKMDRMFRSCYALKELNINGWDTSQVTTMEGMFYDLSELQTLDLSAWNTSKVTDMSYMFYQASELVSIDVSGEFDTSQVTAMRSMFAGTYSLTSIDVSGFDTGQVTDMAYMFQSMALKELDISHFDTKNVTYMDYMLSNLKLQRLKLGGDFSFKGNPSLRAPVGLQETDKLTGNWIREDGNSIGYSPTAFVANYGTGDLEPGSYVAEIKEEITFEEVPENLAFNESMLSNKTKEIQRKEADWKMVVQDTRKEKTEWRVTAQLAKPFQTGKGDSLADILQYRKSGQEDQVIGTTDAVTVFNGGGTDSSLTDVQWNEGEGPYLKVAPGTAKVGRYTCEIQWTLLDTPI